MQIRPVASKLKMVRQNKVNKVAGPTLAPTVAPPSLHPHFAITEADLDEAAGETEIEKEREAREAKEATAARIESELQRRRNGLLKKPHLKNKKDKNKKDKNEPVRKR